MIFSALYRRGARFQGRIRVSPYYPRPSGFESEIEPSFEKRMYDPFRGWLYRMAGRMRSVQAGSIHAYLAYIFVALARLLLFGVRR